MSLQNHPNFHAVKFTTDVTSSFYECLRNIDAREAVKSLDDNDVLHKLIVNFVGNVERLVDTKVKKFGKIAHKSW